MNIYLVQKGGNIPMISKYKKNLGDRGLKNINLNKNY